MTASTAIIPCFSREISLSEITAEVPQVSPAKLGATGPQGGTFGEMWRLAVANSLFGNSAVRLGAAEISTRHRGLVRVAFTRIVLRRLLSFINRHAK